MVLIEDDRDVLHVLTVLLEITGASVTPFASVRAALDALHTAQPHVIVSDIGMPGEDGFVLAFRCVCESPSSGTSSSRPSPR